MIRKKKKRGSVFLQTLIILIFIIAIVSFTLSMINYNHMKSQTFNFYSDKKSLNLEEELILKEINKDNNYTYSNGDYELIIKRGDYYLIKKATNSNYYFKLEMKEHNGGNILIPTYYKTENIEEEGINYD